MKKPRIFIGTNVLTQVDSNVFGNQIGFYLEAGRNSKYELCYTSPGRLSIDNMRNMCAKKALEMECDYLLFIDDDMLLQPNTLESLMSSMETYDICMALTFIRAYPFRPMFFKRKITEVSNEFALEFYDDYEEHIKEDGTVSCAAIGFATCLMKTKILKDLEPPFFVTGPNHTEDVYFCVKAQMELPYEIKIGVDTKVPTGHLLDRNYVSRDNVKLLRKFHEEVLGEQSQAGARKDRDINYYRSIEELTV